MKVKELFKDGELEELGLSDIGECDYVETKCHYNKDGLDYISLIYRCEGVLVGVNLNVD